LPAQKNDIFFDPPAKRQFEQQKKAWAFYFFLFHEFKGVLQQEKQASKILSVK
jgi:hypothetical protein